MRNKAFGIILLFSLVAAAIMYTMLDRDGSMAAKGLAELRQGIEDLAKRMEDSVPHVYDKTRYYYDEENETSHFVGYVYDPEGNTVPNANVYHIPRYASPETTRTDSTGFFDLPRKHDGYGYTGSGYGAFAPGLATTEYFGSQTSVGITGRIRLTLEPAGKVTGRVVDRDGIPITNASIKTEETRLYDTTTNANGEYVIEDVLLNGIIGLWVKAVGYGQTNYTLESRDRVGEEPLDPTRTYEAPDIVLETADKVISGTVVDSNGNPVERQELRIYSERLGWVRVYSDSEGEFVFPHVLDEVYRVSAIVVDDLEKFVIAYGNLEASGGEIGVVMTLNATRSSYIKGNIFR